jgi:hypothetical protein
MPIWLRKYIASEISEFYQKEAEEIKKAKSDKNTKNFNMGDTNKRNIPDFLKKSPKRQPSPSYSTKLSKNPRK